MTTVRLLRNVAVSVLFASGALSAGCNGQGVGEACAVQSDCNDGLTCQVVGAAGMRCCPGTNSRCGALGDIAQGNPTPPDASSEADASVDAPAAETSEAASDTQSDATPDATAFGDASEGGALESGANGEDTGESSVTDAVSEGTDAEGVPDGDASAPPSEASLIGEN